MYYNFWQLIDAMIQHDLEEESRQLQRELKYKKWRIARCLKNRENNILYHQLVNEHFASAKLADEAFSLLRRASCELKKINELIKQAKQGRKIFRIKRDFIKADDLTQLIAQLARIYTGLKHERDAFRAKTRELNDNTAKLRESIRKNCGTRGRKWYDRFQARRSLN